MSKKRRSPPSSAARRISTFYVIELSRDCVKEPCALAPLYVGQTAHDPEHRFAQHKAGGNLPAGKAHRYGERLRWDLMDKVSRCATRKEAEAMEKAVAEALQ